MRALSNKCLVIAEMSAKLSESPTAVVQRAISYLSANEKTNTSIQTWVAFSDSPLAKDYYYSLDLYLEHKVFESLPVENVLPVLAINARKLHQINSLISRIRSIGINKLLVVSGDEQSMLGTHDKRSDFISTLDFLKQHQTDNDFDIFTAAQSFGDLEYLEEKIQYGPKYVIGQPIYHEEEFKRFITDFTRMKVEPPLLMCVTPLSSRRLLESIKDITELRLPGDIYARMSRLDDATLRQEGIELSKKNIRSYFNVYKKLTGIYVYTWSVSVLSSMLSEIAACAERNKQNE
jgi:5,10-methylenetetrahydrofolate reductase